ncbi:Hsp70 family protein [Streptococcus oralis]|uniref:Hsp70 family protein n=1 Tax=Streptococcus oralis TaxID=1303 RepID=UPI0022844DCD|nr:Hsp70 family protein [Streptococcus oralis]MCY7102934.1 Hsp70 family protein [Streptococcus oralis]
MVVVGIDLGTTFSAVSVFRDGQAQILHNLEGRETTPSVIFFDDPYEGKDETVVGVQAKNMAAIDPDNVVQFIKRQMGKSYTFISPAGVDYTPESLSAIILKKLVQDAELSLGETIKDVVITVPAYFDDSQRTATKHAGEIAGLNVLRIINEPTAAALAFGVDKEKDGKVFVYDLGGGTFDVTLLEIKNGNIDVISTTGDSNLGGTDFDQVIVTNIIRKLEGEGVEVSLDNDKLIAEIREKAEKIKVSLSQKMQAKERFTIDGDTYPITVTRDEFETESKELVNRTTWFIDEIFEEQQIGWSDIEHILMVGGSTKMPMIRDRIEQLSGKTIVNDVQPDYAVAQGASILAILETKEDLTEEEFFSISQGKIDNVEISDVTSQSLGVIVIDSNDKKVNMHVILHNTKLPAECSKNVYTRYEHQASILVQVTEGDDTELEFVKIIGEKELPLSPNLPKGSPIKITYLYDIDQTVFIEVYDLTVNGLIGTFSIDRINNLDQAGVNAQKIALDKLSIE